MRQTRLYGLKRKIQVSLPNKNKQAFNASQYTICWYAQAQCSNYRFYLPISVLTANFHGLAGPPSVLFLHLFQQITIRFFYGQLPLLSSNEQCQSTDPNQWPGLILSSSTITTRCLWERTSVHVCRLSNESTLKLRYNLCKKDFI